MSRMDNATRISCMRTAEQIVTTLLENERVHDAAIGNYDPSDVSLPEIQTTDVTNEPWTYCVTALRERYAPQAFFVTLGPKPEDVRVISSSRTYVK